MSGRFECDANEPQPKQSVSGVDDAGEDGEDVDDTERGERGADGAVLRRPAGLLLGGGLARRQGPVRRLHLALRQHEAPLRSTGFQQARDQALAT